MRDKTLPLLLLATWPFCDPANAQVCTETIPAIATIIDTDGPWNGSGTFFWVCGGTNVTFNNTFGIVYVEEGCDIVINSIGGGIYHVKGGGSVTINTPGVQLAHAPGTSVINNAGSGTVTACSSMTFEYTNTPVPGCDISTGTIASREHRVGIRSDPSNKVIHLDGVSGVQAVRILDTMGRIIRTPMPPFNRVEVRGLPPGSYLLEVQWPDARTLNRIVVH